MSVDPSRIRILYTVVDCNGLYVNRAAATDTLDAALDIVDDLSQPGHADPSSAPFSVVQITDLAPE